MTIFAVVLALLIVFMVGYWLGQENATPCEGHVGRTKSVTGSIVYKNATTAPGATDTAGHPQVQKRKSKPAYNLDFDPIDCDLYPSSRNASEAEEHLVPLVYPNSTHKELANKTYYTTFHAGTNDKIRWMTNARPETLMDRVIDATQGDDSIFVDVGGNIGLYTLSALTLGIPTLSVEPISINLENLCEAWRKNVREGLVTTTQHVTLLKAAVSNEISASMNISRPAASFGRNFDQASLFSNTIGVVKRPPMEVETVPLIRLDHVIPDSTHVGFVKIDVQGAESLVLKGMEGLLKRTIGYPKAVFYEEQARIIKRAGVSKLGESRKYLESFGYACQQLQNDILCEKK